MAKVLNLIADLLDRHITHKEATQNTTLYQQLIHFGDEAGESSLSLLIVR